MLEIHREIHCDVAPALHLMCTTVIDSHAGAPMACVARAWSAVELLTAAAALPRMHSGPSR